MGQRQGEGCRHEKALHDPKQGKDLQVGCKGERCGGNGEEKQADRDRALALDRAGECSRKQAGDGHAQGARSRRHADFGGHDPVDLREARKDRLGREQVDEREETNDGDQHCPARR